MLCKKIFTGVVLVLAIGMALAAILIPAEYMEKTILVVSRFFEVMLPILATGALIKYLVCCPYSYNKGECNKEDINSRR